MALHSTRPYRIVDGRAYCAACGRHRLARIVGTAYLCCPVCDAGHEVAAGRRTVAIVGRELLCARCRISALVPAPGGGNLECPLCDTPPWERAHIATPIFVQDSLLPGEEGGAGGRGEGEASRPPAPVPVVRVCAGCRQTVWQRPEWRTDRWVLACEACGARLPNSRVNRTRSNRSKGVTQ